MSNSSFQAALSEMNKKGILISPKKEFYAIVPTEYIGKPLPPSNYIDALMKHLNKSYYVGCLSASAIHGATHQQPMEFQVITKGAIRNIELEGVHISFLAKKNIEEIPTDKVKTRTGYMNVSTVEVTLLDLVKYIEHAGYLDNVANIVIELQSKIRARNLGTASKSFETTVLQRTGYLIDQFCEDKSLSRFIHEEVQKREPQFIPLATYSKKQSHRNEEKWKIKVNESVAADI